MRAGSSLKRDVTAAFKGSRSRNNAGPHTIWPGTVERLGVSISSTSGPIFRPDSSRGYQTPAGYAGIITAPGSNAAGDQSFALPPICHTAPNGMLKNAEPPIAFG